MSKSYSIRTTVRDDFVPLAYNGQWGEDTHHREVVPPVSGLGGGEEKQKKRKEKATEGMQWILTSLDSEASKGLYWEDVNKIPGPNLQGGACP
jgi:hypothetical protein